jgi:hypothetical protein
MPQYSATAMNIKRARASNPIRTNNGSDVNSLKIPSRKSIDRTPLGKGFYNIINDI